MDTGIANILPTLTALIEGLRALPTTVTPPVFASNTAPILPSVVSAHLGMGARCHAASLALEPKWIWAGFLRL